MKLSMRPVQLLHKQAGGSLLDQIHDELLGRTVTLSSSQRKGFNAEVARLMTTQVELSVPLEAEVGYGKTWREAKSD